MKRYLLILFFSFSFFFLNAQDVIYTIKGEIDSLSTTVDSILVENISNNSRILFDKLPDRKDYYINLTQKALWGRTLTPKNEQNPGFKVTSNYPGYLCLTYNHNISTVASLSIYNMQGQEVYKNKNHILSKGNLIRIYLGPLRFYVVRIKSSYGVQGFKVVGSNRNDKTKVSYSQQAFPFYTVFEKPAIIDSNFSYNPGDSIRISIYKHKYYAFPKSFKIVKSDSLDFRFKVSHEDSTGISDAYRNLSNTSMSASITNYDTSSGVIQIKYSGQEPKLNQGEIITIDMDTIGYLRKVINTVKDGKTLTVKTAPAQLSDIFINKNIKLDTRLIAPKITLKSTSTYKEISKALTDKDGYIHPVEIIYHDHNGRVKTENVLKKSSINDGRVSIIDFYRDLAMDLYGKEGRNVHFYIKEGHVSLLSDAIFEINYKDEGSIASRSKAKRGTLNSFKFYLNSHASFLIKLGLDLNKEYEKEKVKRLIKIPKVRAKFLIGPVPVWITFYCGIYGRYYFKSDASMHADWGFESDQVLKVGGTYTKANNSFIPIAEYTPHNSVFPLNVEGEINDSIRLEIYPRIDVRIYDVFGPYAEIVPYVTGNYHAKFQSQVTALGMQGFLAWNSGIDLGLDFRVGVELSILSIFKRDFGPIPFNCFDTKLWSSPRNIKLMTAIPGNIGLGKTLDLTYKVTDLLGNSVSLCPVYLKGDGKFNFQLIASNTNGEVKTEWTATNAGNKTIDAIIFNANKNIIAEASSNIIVNNPPPIAGFIAVPTLGSLSLTVNFIDQSSNNPKQWQWDFGDGSMVSTEKSPSHKYTKAGKYTVTLTVINNYGKSTKKKPDYIVTGNLPVANFTANQTTGKVSFTVKFTDQSSGNPISWDWEFGDGGISSDQNPTHSYQNAGTYTVKLTVTNKFGTGTPQIKNGYIIVNKSGSKPTADFTATPVTGSVPLTVQFIDNSLGVPSSWHWDFGDGTSSPLRNPSHTYQQSGNFTVKLTATNEFGYDTKTEPDYINVSNTGNTAPTASFTLSPQSGTTSTTFSFDASGCSDKEDPVSKLQVHWDFDGNGTWDTDWSIKKTATHIYPVAGNYTVKMEVKDSGGLTDEISYTVVVSNGGGGNTAPIASFTFSPSSGTTSTTFSFDASKCSDKEDLATKLQVHWDFDGNGTWDTDWSTKKTATHIYPVAGNYTVKMEVKDSGGLTGETSHTIVVSSATGSFIDTRDGQIYKTVKIGDQIWMAQNLNYKTDDSSWYYNNDSRYADPYGRLYTWNAAKEACPSGWHLPSDEEWKKLEMYLGMNQSEANKDGWRGKDEGKKMKSTYGWNDNSNGTNSSGFNALPGGKYVLGVYLAFFDLIQNSYWWTATTSDSGSAWFRELHFSDDNVFRAPMSIKYNALSVRCVKNKE